MQTTAVLAALLATVSIIAGLLYLVSKNGHRALLVVVIVFSAAVAAIHLFTGNLLLSALWSLTVVIYLVLLVRLVTRIDP